MRDRVPRSGTNAGDCHHANRCDRRVGQHRHRSALQAAPVGAHRTDLHGRRRPQLGRTRSSSRSRHRGISRAGSTGCSPDLISRTWCSRRPVAYVHAGNAPRYLEAGIRAIDLTPAAIGPYVDPAGQSDRTPRRDERQHGHVRRSGDDPHGARRLAGWSTCPTPRSSQRSHPGRPAPAHGPTSTSSPARRAPAIEASAASGRGKAIIVLNPAEPPLIMRDTIFCQIPDDADHDAITASIREVAAYVQTYVPGYRLTVDPQFVRDPRRHPSGRRSSSRSRAPATSSRRTPATSTS